MYDFIDSCLRNKNDMVIYEAAATIVSLKCITSKELRSAINILQAFLSSPKSVSRYAAVRTLNKVSIDYPVEVATKLFSHHFSRSHQQRLLAKDVRFEKTSSIGRNRA